MSGLLVRVSISLALLITWAWPASHLSVLPRERALRLAAEAICFADANDMPVQAALRMVGRYPGAGPALTAALADPRLRDIAPLFESTTTRQWTSELARASLAVLAALLMLSRWRWAPVLVIAAALLYFAFTGVRWDAYQLLVVTESPRLWWLAISQWPPAWWLERLVAPMAGSLCLLGASVLCVLSLRGVRTAARATQPRGPALVPFPFTSRR
jgi:hypothetical protein